MSQFDPDLEEDETVERLLPIFESTLKSEIAKDNAAKTPEERRQIRIESRKALIKACFMANPLATEEDFERLWPSMFDNALIEYAQTTHMNVIERLVEDLEDEDDEVFDDDEFNDGDLR